MRIRRLRTAVGTLCWIMMLSLAGCHPAQQPAPSGNRKIEDRVDNEAAGPSGQPAAEVAQKVVLYEEDPGEPQGKRMIAITDVQGSRAKWNTRIRQRAHQKFARTTACHDMHTRLYHVMFIIGNNVVSRRQNADMLCTAQDTNLHIDPVHAPQQVRLQYFGGRRISHDAALKEHQAREIARSQVQIMHGSNDRDARLAIQFLHQFQQLDLVFDIQV